MSINVLINRVGGIVQNGPMLGVLASTGGWFAWADTVPKIRESMKKTTGMNIRYCISCLTERKGDLKGGSYPCPWP